MIGDAGSAMIRLWPGTQDRVATAWVVSSKTLAGPVSDRKPAARLLCSLEWTGTDGLEHSNTGGASGKYGERKDNSFPDRRQIRAAQENLAIFLRRINLKSIWSLLKEKWRIRMKQMTSLEKAHAQADHIFHDLFPAHGLAVRSAQIELCHEMIDAMFLNRIALCDAGVGIGKTHAYLVAGLLWQKYRPGSAPFTMTISTSSVALQNAIVKEYIPFLSEVLLEDGILDRPVRSIIRKGRERYACDLRLAVRQAAVMGHDMISTQRLAALKALDKSIDLDEIPNLSAFDRTQVCVPSQCSPRCSIQHGCRYQQFLAAAKQEAVNVQICNHNYLLADAIHRQQENRPLLRDHHILIVDEAHKLAEAARQMYGETLALSEIKTLCTSLEREHCAMIARRLRDSVLALAEILAQDTPEQESSQQPFTWTPERKKAITVTVSLLRQAAQIARKYARRSSGTVHELERAADRLFLFSEERSDQIRYIQTGLDEEVSLCAVQPDTPARLARDLWHTGKSAILASGTLAAGGSFARARQQLGLEKDARCREFTAPSPFDYERNCLLYLPSDLSCANVDKMSKRLRQLIQATHGHALVLFTSYILMSTVCQRLRGTIPFPLIEAWRGNQQAVAQFKALPNAVLCAAGPCWEGIDFPGNMVSLLVIVRLPFPTPNPVRDAEKAQYPSLREYINAAVVPEMQTKLRQGVGRAIRTETDSCVIAILDQRAKAGERYHDAVRRALPPCPLTSDIAEVERFIRARKRPDYYGLEGKAG